MYKIKLIDYDTSKVSLTRKYACQKACPEETEARRYDEIFSPYFFLTFFFNLSSYSSGSLIIQSV